MTTLKGIYNFFFNLLLWIIFLTTVGPFILLFCATKLLVLCLAKSFGTNLYLVTPNDTYFAVDSSEHTSKIVFGVQVWRIKGRIEVSEFRTLFFNSFLSTEKDREKYRNFYCYLSKYLGYVFKKAVATEDLDLFYHINTREVSPQNSLEASIAEWIFVEKIKPKRPLWQITLIPLPMKDSNDESPETLLLFKIHHCLADGYSFIHIIDKLTLTQTLYNVRQQLESFPSKVSLAITAPIRLFEYWNEINQTPEILYPPKFRNERKWYISFATLDLETVKAVRRDCSVHFVALMMSLMIGALRRHITNNKLPLSQNVSIPDHIWTANSLPWPNHPRNTLINHWTGGVFKIPFRTTCPIERLKKTQSYFRHFHEMGLEKLIRRVVILITWCLPSFILRWARSKDLHYFKYSNAFASLMLNEKRYKLLGKEVSSLYLPLAISDSVPSCVLFGVSCSHSNQLDLSICANNEIIASQTQLDELIQTYVKEELQELSIKILSMKSCSSTNELNSRPSTRIINL